MRARRIKRIDLQRIISAAFLWGREKNRSINAQNDKSFDALILLKYLYRFTYSHFKSRHFIDECERVCVYIAYIGGLKHFV